MFNKEGLRQIYFLNISYLKSDKKSRRNSWFSFSNLCRKKNEKLSLKTFLIFRKIYPLEKFQNKYFKNLASEKILQRKKHYFRSLRQPGIKRFHIYKDHFLFKYQISTFNPSNFPCKNGKTISRSNFSFPFFTQIDQLWNDLIHFIIISCGKSWIKAPPSKTIGSLTILVYCLWTIDCQYHKFFKRKIHGGRVSPPPHVFMSFFAQKSYQKLWEDISLIDTIRFPQKKNKILKAIELRKLSFYLQVISRDPCVFPDIRVFQSFWFYSLVNLSFSFQSYAEYNRISLKRIEKNHSRILPRNMERFTFLKTVEADKNKPLNDFKSNQSLLKKLTSLKNYQPFEVGSFLPKDKQKRGKILENLKFPFPVERLEFIPGGNKRKIVIFWKIPFDKHQRDLAFTKLIIEKAKKKFPLYDSRNMAKLKSKK